MTTNMKAAEWTSTVWDRDGIYVVVGPIWECAFELSKDAYHREYA